MATENTTHGGPVIAEIQTDDEYEAALERLDELMKSNRREERAERDALRDVIGRYRERELIWARAW